MTIMYPCIICGAMVGQASDIESSGEDWFAWTRRAVGGD